MIESADKKIKCNEPGGGEDPVHLPVKEAAGEGAEPDQEDGNASNNFLTPLSASIAPALDRGLIPNQTGTQTITVGMQATRLRST